MKFCKKLFAALLSVIMLIAGAMPITSYAAATKLTHEMGSSQNGNFLIKDYNADDFIYTEIEGVTYSGGNGYIYLTDADIANNPIYTITMNSGSYTSSVSGSYTENAAAWHYGDKDTFCISTDTVFSVTDVTNDTVVNATSGFGSATYENSSGYTPVAETTSIVTKFDIDVSGYVAGDIHTANEYQLQLKYKYQMKKKSWVTWNTAKETLDPETIYITIKVTHDYQDTVTAPTCTSNGFTTHKCSQDDTYYIDSTVPALEHSFTEEIVAPTCTAHGYTKHTCTREGCGYSYNDTDVDPTKHSYIDTVTPPTCTSNGFTTHTCIVCDYSFVDTFVANLGHDTVVDPAVPTSCDHTGLTEGSHCSRCEAVFVAQEIIPALEHTYGPYVSNNNATCSSNSTKSAICEVCGYKDTLDEPDTKLPHSFEDVVTAPTCTTDGYTTHTCSVCGYSQVDTFVSALGHNYIEEVVSPTCTANGYTAYTCTGCGHTYQALYVNAKGHSFGTNNETCSVCGVANPNYVNATEQQYMEEFGVDAATAIEINNVVKEYNLSSQTIKITESSVTSRKSDSDMAGSTFKQLKAQSSTLKNNSIKITWSKVKGADGYIIYANKCGKNNKMKKVKTVGNGTTSFTYSKLKKGTYHKFMVVAYKDVNGKKVTLAASKILHIATLGGKYGSAKSVKINSVGGKKGAAKVTLKVKKTAVIKASEVKQSMPIKKHRAIAYESSNPQVAKVDSKGKITAVEKGTCTIYVYAQNGKYKTVKVTVK